MQTLSTFQRDQVVAYPMKAYLRVRVMGLVSWIICLLVMLLPRARQIKMSMTWSWPMYPSLNLLTCWIEELQTSFHLIYLSKVSKDKTQIDQEWGKKNSRWSSAIKINSKGLRIQRFKDRLRETSIKVKTAVRILQESNSQLQSLNIERIGMEMLFSMKGWNPWQR